MSIKTIILGVVSLAALGSAQDALGTVAGIPIVSGFPIPNIPICTYSATVTKTISYCTSSYAPRTESLSSYTIPSYTIPTFTTHAAPLTTPSYSFSCDPTLTKVSVVCSTDAAATASESASSTTSAAPYPAATGNSTASGVAAATGAASSPAPFQGAAAGHAAPYAAGVVVAAVGGLAAFLL
ncbi:MAG: hypothetical protein M1826_000564 [Phylliscum demangeonii]|nr:MAG: hypothetical protein M1826_000564 [Phylliscum demangeonii]